MNKSPCPADTSRQAYTRPDDYIQNHSFCPPPHPHREIPSNVSREQSKITQAALQPNEAIGDDLSSLINGVDDGKNYTLVDSGNELTNPTWRSQVIRVYFQNVNGLRASDNGIDVLDAFYQMESIRSDIFGFAETKLNCRATSVQSMLYTQKKKVWPHCKITTGSSDLPWHTTSKPGGVLLGVTGPLVGRVQHTIQDDLGRWTGVELLGRDGRKLAIICAYQVCQRSGGQGEFTAYAQQVSILRRRGQHHVNPRKQFVIDLVNLLRPYVESRADIILMGDFNESIGLKSTGMAHVTGECRLTDVQTHRHGLEIEQSTYARGPNRVDYFLVSDRLLPYVIRQGCEPFNTRIFSDHRGIFMDLSYPGFFDRAPNTLAPPALRDLIYDCPGHIRKYLTFLKKYLSDHNLLERAAKMAEEYRDDAFAERFDRDFTAGLLAAEARCKNFKRSPWSKPLHEAMLTKEIIKRQITFLLTNRDMSAVIKTMQDKLPSPINIPISLPEAKKALRAAQLACRHVVSKARDLARNHQENRIVAKQLANPEKDPDKIAKIIRNRDATKEMWRRIPNCKPRASSGISMIKVPTNPDEDPKHPTTVFKTVVDPSQMEELILKRNKQHFRQAAQNPLASPRLSKALGWGADSDASESLLAGTAKTTDLIDDKYAQEILANCHRINDEIEPSISIDQIQNYYLKWKVRTSTAPSGRHLSHFHALFHPTGALDDSADEHRDFQATKDALWFTHHACISYALRHGYSFERWRQVVNTMIEKDPGNPKIHRLRVIHLYENDYNLLLGIKFRQVIHKCIDNDQINPGCYGGLATKQSLDPVFLEMMQYDYTLMTRFDSIKFANDAGSCYDRIIVPPSNVIARSRGLHAHVAKIHGNTLEKAVFRIKTQLGISQGHYSHSEADPVFGTGQGSTASPPTWTLNGSLYFDVYDKHCNGADYVDMDNSITLHIGMAGYIDDNCAQVNSHPSKRTSIIQRATHDAQLWNDILWASGGILEHEKCSYHFMVSDFDRNGAPVLRSGTHGDPIQIIDAFGKTTTLKQLSVYTPYKTLGTYQCPGPAQRKQESVLVTKSQSLVRALATSSCHGHPAWMFYSSVFCKSIGYPLAASRLSDKQLRRIQGPMIPVILNRLGYERRMAHALAFGPRSYGGLGITHLQTVKYSSQLNLVIRHLRTPGQPGTLARINFNRLQYGAGVSYDIFETPSTALPHLEGTWLPMFRDLLANVGASLRISELKILPPQREKDEYIMDIALAHSFSDRDIRFINYCRYFFQSLTVSDLCSACGTRLAHGVYAGEKTDMQSASTLNEPYQEKPGNGAWQAWRKLLRIICDRHGRLNQPMGKWLMPADKLRRRWPFIFAPSCQALFKRGPDGYCAVPRISSGLYSYLVQPQTTIDLPHDCSPIDIGLSTEGYRVYKTGDIAPPPKLPSLASLSFREYLGKQQDYDRCALLRFDTFGRDIHDVVDEVSDFTDIVLVSDGGAAHKCGSFGWVLGTRSGRRIAQGSGSVFGYDPSSYRAEISGSRAGLLFICHAHVYCERPFPTGTLNVYCDNIGYIHKIQKMAEYSLAPVACCLDAEWDILISVHTLLELFSTRPILHHIKGHQDRTIPYDDLDPIAQMNVDADKLATYELHEFGQIYKIVPFDPSCGVALCIDGSTITRNIERSVQEKLFLGPLRSYLCNRFQWSNETFDSIDWESFSQVYSHFPRSRKFFYQFGWKKLPTGARLHSREARYDDRCPSCYCADESDDHLFRCTHQDRRQWRISLIKGIRDKFSTFFDPELLDMLCIGIQCFFRDEVATLHRRFPDPHNSCGAADSISDQSTLSSESLANADQCYPLCYSGTPPTTTSLMTGDASVGSNRPMTEAGAACQPGCREGQGIAKERYSGNAISIDRRLSEISYDSDEFFHFTSHTDDDDSIV